MIYDYFKVDKKGNIIERYRLEEEDSLIEFRQLVKAPTKQFKEPVYDYQNKVWIEGKSLEESLVEFANFKIENLRKECTKIIINGFPVTISNTVYHFSYSVEKQQNFSDTMRLFDNNMIDNIEWNAYLEDEKVRIQLNKEEFTKVYIDGVQHKMNALTRLNNVLIPMVEAAKNKETIARIYWDTGLPAEELSLKEGKSIDDQIGQLSKKDRDLEQANTMTMMALIQISSQIK